MNGELVNLFRAPEALSALLNLKYGAGQWEQVSLEWLAPFGGVLVLKVGPSKYESLEFFAGDEEACKTYRYEAGPCPLASFKWITTLPSSR